MAFAETCQAPAIKGQVHLVRAPFQSRIVRTPLNAKNRHWPLRSTSVPWWAHPCACFNFNCVRQRMSERDDVTWPAFSPRTARPSWPSRTAR